MEKSSPGEKNVTEFLDQLMIVFFFSCSKSTYRKRGLYLQSSHTYFQCWEDGRGVSPRALSSVVLGNPQFVSPVSCGMGSSLTRERLHPHDFGVTISALGLFAFLAGLCKASIAVSPLLGSVENILGTSFALGFGLQMEGTRVWREGCGLWRRVTCVAAVGLRRSDLASLIFRARGDSDGDS